MKQFTHRNEGFVCEVCGANVPDAKGTCRNHCTECLCSKHVDENPGDRKASCLGVMRPIGIGIKGGMPEKIFFKCEKCGFKRPNKIAEDDNKDKILEIMGKGFRE